jgi:hypothetical protein
VQRALWGFEASAALANRPCLPALADAMMGPGVFGDYQAGDADNLCWRRSALGDLIDCFSASDRLTGLGPAATVAWTWNGAVRLAHDVSILMSARLA